LLAHFGGFESTTRRLFGSFSVVLRYQAPAWRAFRAMMHGRAVIDKHCMALQAT
jgi:hypothetical protein